jgi:hypothetical protein
MLVYQLDDAIGFLGIRLLYRYNACAIKYCFCSWFSPVSPDGMQHGQLFIHSVLEKH